MGRDRVVLFVERTRVRAALPRRVQVARGPALYDREHRRLSAYDGIEGRLRVSGKPARRPADVPALQGPRERRRHGEALFVVLHGRAARRPRRAGRVLEGRVRAARPCDADRPVRHTPRRDRVRRGRVGGRRLVRPVPRVLCAGARARQRRVHRVPGPPRRARAARPQGHRHGRRPGAPLVDNDGHADGVRLLLWARRGARGRVARRRRGLGGCARVLCRRRPVGRRARRRPAGRKGRGGAGRRPVRGRRAQERRAARGRVHGRRPRADACLCHCRRRPAEQRRRGVQPAHDAAPHRRCGRQARGAGRRARHRRARRPARRLPVAHVPRACLGRRRRKAHTRHRGGAVRAVEAAHRKDRRQDVRLRRGRGGQGRGRLHQAAVGRRADHPVRVRRRHARLPARGRRHIRGAARVLHEARRAAGARAARRAGGGIRRRGPARRARRLAARDRAALLRRRSHGV